MAEDPERRRSIAADYQALFSTPVGERVLDHLTSEILRMGRPHGLGPLTSEVAVYALALHDTAAQIHSLIGYDFTADRPVVHTNKMLNGTRLTRAAQRARM